MRSIPTTATAPANTKVNNAITATCLNVTPFVAFVILLSVTLNNIKDKLIISILIAPFAIAFNDSPNSLNEMMLTATIPSIKIDPNSAGTPVFAIVARTIDVNAIIPDNVNNIIEGMIAFLKCLLFLDNFLATGIILPTIFDRSIAPNIAGPAVTAAIARNIDVINKLPASTVILLAALAPFLIISLFFVSFLAKGKILVIVLSKLLIPTDANFAHNAAKINFLIALFNEDARSLRSFAALAPFLISLLFFVSFFEKLIILVNALSISLIPLDASLDHNDVNIKLHITLFNDDDSSTISFDILLALRKVFSFFCISFDIVNIEFLPTKISLNFLITSFLIMRSILQLTFDNDFIICGAALISLITASRSFSFMSNSSWAFLNTFVMSFTFRFPIRISFNEIFFNLLNASTTEVSPPPVFSFSIFFTIASATFSEALSLNLAMAGVLLISFPSFIASLSIAFLMLLVSSRMLSICLWFIFVEVLSISIDFFSLDTSTSFCRRFLTSSTIL